MLSYEESLKILKETNALINKDFHSSQPYNALIIKQTKARCHM